MKKHSMYRRILLAALVRGGARVPAAALAVSLCAALLSALIAISFDMPAQMGRELRWRLRLVGRTDVRLYASGGLDEHTLAKLADVYDGFGVGTAVADAPTMDFALKIVEVDGIPRAKVGNPLYPWYGPE